MERRPRLAALLGVPAVVALAALEVRWYGQGAWSFSDGVYLKTAQLVLAGREPYGAVAFAQPPVLAYVGAGAVQVGSTLQGVRWLLALLSLVVGGAAALATWRLTARPAAAVVAALAALLTPWYLREHLTLTPETLATPLLLVAALLAGGRRGALLGGVLAGLAVGTKLSFAVPVVVVVAVLPAGPRGRFALGGVLAAALALLVPLGTWGGAFTDDVIRAQRETGLQLDLLPGYLVQAAWTLVPLGALAALGAAHLLRTRRDDPLARAWIGLALGSVLLLATLLKRGTYLNGVAQMEPALVVLAVVGAWSGWERGTARRALVVVGALWVGVQSASLLLAPDDPTLFRRPLSAPAVGRELSGAQVAARVAAARTCPAGSVFAGTPLIAFAARVPMPDGQPDTFLRAAAPRALARYRSRPAPVCRAGAG